MVYIKKLVLKGFKSFAKETEIPFVNGMNSIVGPNGSGKSNVADAICFVLGRLSMKSIRAAKSANLIFAGTKEHKPSHEAGVKIVFDNSDKKFSVNENEITIERLVRSNGQGIYKINGEAKTRQEILELLALAGIDPYGYNIVLQGKIADIVKMTSEDRRKVIEEVAGISVYELRKEKSLKELEKTEERLKEVSTTLRERHAYLKNLEEERKQALKFKKLEEMVKKCKANILHKKIEGKIKQLKELDENKQHKEKEREKEKERVLKIENKINEMRDEIMRINSSINASAGTEVSSLNEELVNIRADMEGLNVRKETCDNKLLEIEERKKRTEEKIKSIEEELLRLRKEFPSQAKKNMQLEEKKKELEKVERERKSFFSLKEKISSLKLRIEDRIKDREKRKNEISFLLRETEKISSSLLHKDMASCRKEIEKLKELLVKEEKEENEKETLLRENEKLLFSLEKEIINAKTIKKQVEKIDLCPLCKTKITKEHIIHVFSDCDEKIANSEKKIREMNLDKLKEEIRQLKSRVEDIKNKIKKAENDFFILSHVEEKKENIKKISNEEKDIDLQLKELEKLLKEEEKKISLMLNIEEKYDSLFMEIRELSSMNKENLNLELEYKERMLLTEKNAVKHYNLDSENTQNEKEETLADIEEKERSFNEKEKQLEEIEKKNEKLIEKKSNLEIEINNDTSFLYEFRNKIALIENETNNLKIEKARLDAEKSTLETDFLPYQGIELISQNIDALELRMNEAQNELIHVGNVNLKALEVYEAIKKDYEEIENKSKVIENEKLEIVKIIEEIDKKKRKTFMKTLYSINEIFTRNFSQLYTKGNAFLELENKEEPFSAGLDIIIKVGKGKYFDVTSLSGGEKTLVALSLIFAIQEYKPYSFYIFDEVDAALDKRNSERLAVLVKKHMKSGQYIIITHNDAIITESSVLYGVSMQEGISKLVSLEV